MMSPGHEMIPLERTELVTQDMDLIADLIGRLIVEHTASFRCPDRAAVDGRVHAVMAAGLHCAHVRYGGFTYSADVEPNDAPAGLVATHGHGVLSTPQEELRTGPGDVLMLPTDQPSVTAVEDAEYTLLRVPWDETRALAETRTGIRAADLRFEAIAPVSAERAAMFARTAGFVCAELVTSGATGACQLLTHELTHLAAAAFLETFPNTTMTVAYQAGPGWVAPATVRRAAAFIEAHADQPVTLEQIADAAGVTARALQYAFRRHYSMTPIGFLRQARLKRAHRELQAADPARGLTVAAVARRWGWTSSSQFAVAYQQQFGQLPSFDLRSRKGSG